MENEDYIDDKDPPLEEFSSLDEETRYARHSDDEEQNPPFRRPPEADVQQPAQPLPPSDPHPAQEHPAQSNLPPSEDPTDTHPGTRRTVPSYESLEPDSAPRDRARPFSAATDKEKILEGNTPPPLHLYVAANGTRPNPLVRLFGLDVFGTWQLGRAARLNMNSLAILLIIVAFYEFISWMVLFNVILQAGLFRFSFVKTPLAALLAIPFTVVTLLWEQQLVTSDFSDILKNGFQLMAVAMRLGIIALVAFVNSQPIELLVFNYKIEGRLQQERARAEAVRLLRENEEKQNEAKQAITELPSVMSLRAPAIQEEFQRTRSGKDDAGKAESAAKADLDRLRSARDRAEKDKSDATNNLQYLEGEQRKRPNDLEIDSKVALAKKVVSALQNRIIFLDRKIGEASELWKSKNIDLQKAQNEYNNSKTTHDSTENRFGNELFVKGELDKMFLTRLRHFIDKVKSSPTGDPVYEVGSTEKENVFTLPEMKKPLQASSDKNSPQPNEPLPSMSDPGIVAQPQDYDWSDRLRVLYDLRHAVPPRWPDLDNASRIVLANELRFFDVCGIDHNGCAPEPASATADPGHPAPQNIPLRFDDHQQVVREQDAAFFRILYRVVFGLALVVPLFTVAMKLLMRTELKYYYSTAYQANRRHPEAWAFVTFLDRLKQRRRSHSRQPIPEEPAPDFRIYES